MRSTTFIMLFMGSKICKRMYMYRTTSDIPVTFYELYAKKKRFFVVCYVYVVDCFFLKTNKIFFEFVFFTIHMLTIRTRLREKMWKNLNYIKQYFEQPDCSSFWHDLFHPLDNEDLISRVVYKLCGFKVLHFRHQRMPRVFGVMEKS